MGTIQQCRDNTGAVTFQARVRLTGYPPQSRTFPTENEACTWIQETEASLRSGAVLNPRQTQRHTLGDLIDWYIQEVTPAKKGAAAERVRLKAIRRNSICAYAVANLTTQAASPGTPCHFFKSRTGVLDYRPKCSDAWFPPVPRSPAH